MDILEAMQRRHSVRQYRDMPLSTEVKERLQQEIDACNREGDLHLQLVTDEPGAFSGAMARYGRFSGVQNYIAVAGKKAPDLNERAGYYGERIVLLAEKRSVDEVFIRRQLEMVTPQLIPGTEQVVVYRDPKGVELAELFRKHNGSREKVCTELGISKTTLWRRMKKYGLEKGSF